MVANIIIAVIILHLVAGFGWLMYKLSPRDGDELIDNSFDKEGD